MAYDVITLQDSSRLNHNVGKVINDSGVQNAFKKFQLVYGHAGECQFFISFLLMNCTDVL